MDYDAWEDSLSILDIRDLLYMESILRYIAMAFSLPSRCLVGRCRRHLRCVGPLRRKPGTPVPGCWQQLDENGFRPLCCVLDDLPPTPLTLEQVLEAGPRCQRLLEERRLFPTDDLFGNRIARNRAARRTAGV